MKERAKSRKDSKGRVLHKGESERADGRYMYRYSELGGGCIYSPTLEELRKKEKRVQKDLLDGIYVKLAANTTLNDLFEKDMETKQNLRDSTLTNYLLMWDNNVRDTLGKMSACDIKALHIRKLYAEFEKQGMAKATIKFIATLIVSALEIAVQSDMIRKNPAAGVKYGGTVAEKKALTVAEQDSLLDFLNGENIYNVYCPMVVIMIGTGLRVSELCGLTWDDVDFDNNVIAVNKQLLKRKKAAENGQTLYIEKTKTENGTRTIPMTKAVHRAFREQQKLMVALGRRGFTEVDGYSGFIFVTKNNTPFTVTNVNFILKNVINAHNKKNVLQLPHFSAHILRHTAATRMAESGIEPKVLQMILGHSSINITMDIYVDLDKDHIKQEMEKAESIINFA